MLLRSLWEDFSLFDVDNETGAPIFFTDTHIQPKRQTDGENTVALYYFNEINVYSTTKLIILLEDGIAVNSAYVKKTVPWSVCLSVTFVHCAQTAEDIEKLSFAYDSRSR